MKPGPAFLPRLEPGDGPMRPPYPYAGFVQRQYWQDPPLMTVSTRPVQGWSFHLAAMPDGRWVSYRHHGASGNRQFLGGSYSASGLARFLGFFR